MKNSVRVAFVAASALALASAHPARAACSSPPQLTESWTTVWTDPYGQTTYSITAPCKVNFGQQFEIVLAVRDASFPDHLVGGAWSLIDTAPAGAVTLADGGTIWTAAGAWQLTVPQRYTDVAVNHDVQFAFKDMGAGGMAHSWGGSAGGGIVVDPYPDAAPVFVSLPGGTFEHGEPVLLAATVADEDGDSLAYRWVQGGRVVAEGTVEAPAGGAPVALPPLELAGLPVGAHELTLALADGTHEVAAAVSVAVVDTVAPTLAPVASSHALFPPNGRMVPVTILANARDGAGPVSLAVEVTDDADPARGRRALGLDAEVLSIDDSTGEIVVALRAELETRARDRTYTIAVWATDASGNASSAEVVVVVLRGRAAPPALR